MTVVLVDHALARAFDKGAIGQIVITGDPNTEIFESIGKSGTPQPSTVPTTSPPPSATPQGSALPTSTPGEGFHVDIVPGAFTFQDSNAPDEFADTESPADYNINVLMVPLGSTVTWTNHDPSQVHTVTAVDGTFDSGFLNEGQTFSFTFDTPGEFEYFCGPHPWMRAKLMVEMH